MKGLNKLDNEETSQEWEKIKSWLGAADTVKKHPVQEHFERESRKMATGRMVDEEVSPLPPPMQPPVMAQAPVVPEPQIQDHQIEQPASGQQADSILGTNQQELRDYLTRVNTPSMGERAGNAITGLGDAIIQGVGRAGPGHFQENFQKRNQDQRTALNAIPGQVAGLGKEKFELTQKMDSENPDSPYSKISQKTYGPDLIQMGLTPEEVQRMPASLIGDLFAKKVSLEEVKARIAEEASFKNASLDVQRQGLGLQKSTLENNAINQAAERKQKEEDTQRAAATETLKHGENSRIWGVPIPGTSDISGKERKNALGVLSGQMQGSSEHGIPDIGGTFNNEKVLKVRKVK